MVKVAKVRPRFYGRMEVVLDAGTNSLILMPYALLSEIDSFHLKANSVYIIFIKNYDFIKFFVKFGT